MRMSVTIPCYDMGGEGYEVLKHSLLMLSKQSFKDFEVVITDHSENDLVADVCTIASKYLDVKYIRNENRRGEPVPNTNLGLEHCSGEIIKLLCQDDYIYDNNSLKIINDSFTDDVNWLVTSYVHTNDRTNLYRRHIPKLNAKIELINTIGTPSCLTIRNKNILYFDENLSFMYDCEYYKRLLIKYGNPKIVDVVTMVNYLHDNQVTSTVNSDLVNKEVKYVGELYA